MRRDCVSVFIEHVTYMDRQMHNRQLKRLSNQEGTQNMIYVIQQRNSPWSKTAGTLSFGTGITHGRTEEWTDEPTDRRMDSLIDMCS